MIIIGSLFKVLCCGTPLADLIADDAVSMICDIVGLDPEKTKVMQVALTIGQQSKVVFEGNLDYTLYANDEEEVVVRNLYFGIYSGLKKPFVREMISYYVDKEQGKYVVCKHLAQFLNMETGEFGPWGKKGLFFDKESVERYLIEVSGKYAMSMEFDEEKGE